MSDKEIWGIIEEWVEYNKKILNFLYYKWGWLTSSEKEDVMQEIFLICYRVLKRYIKENPNYDIKNLIIDKTYKNRVIGNFQARSWQKRNDLTLRKEDIYNIQEEEKNNNSNVCLKVDVSEIEKFIRLDTFDNDENELENIRNDKIEKIKVLLNILKKPRRMVIQSMFTGTDDKGYLTSTEAGELFNLKQNSVNKGIQYSIATIQDFIKANNISLDMPIDEIERIVNSYNSNINNSLINCDYCGNIEDFINN